MTLLQRLSDGSAVFGVVGLGYVGLPLVVEMARSGHRVIGIDIARDKVEEVSAGRSYIPDVPTHELAPMVSAGLIEATTDFSRAGECDVLVICVPTPLDAMKEPDTSFMESAARQIAPHLRPGDAGHPGVDDVSGGPPRRSCSRFSESFDLKVGTDLYLAFSPERVDPGNPVYQTKNTPKVVGGVTAQCTEAAVAFYERFLDTVVPVSSTRTAEMTQAP